MKRDYVIVVLVAIALTAYLHASFDLTNFVDEFMNCFQQYRPGDECYSPELCEQLFARGYLFEMGPCNETLGYMWQDGLEARVARLESHINPR